MALHSNRRYRTGKNIEHHVDYTEVFRRPNGGRFEFMVLLVDYAIQPAVGVQ